MNNKVQQRFDRSIADAMKVKLASKPRATPVDPSRFAEAKTSEDRRGWKLHLDPQTGATVWGPP